MDDIFPTIQHQTSAAASWSHDIVALIPPHEHDSPSQVSDVLSVTYRVFEVWPTNFESICQLLRDNDWFSNGICPLVLCHFNLSKSQAARLPRYVSWRRVDRTVEEELKGFREILVEPLRVRGFICVDFADYIAALSFGGEILLWHATGATISEAIANVLRQIDPDRSILAETVACCLGIQMPWQIALEDLEQAIEAISNLFPESVLHVPSTLFDRGRGDFKISLLSVMTRPHLIAGSSSLRNES